MSAADVSKSADDVRGPGRTEPSLVRRERLWKLLPETTPAESKAERSRVAWKTTLRVEALEASLSQLGKNRVWGTKMKHNTFCFTPLKLVDSKFYASAVIRKIVPD